MIQRATLPLGATRPRTKAAGSLPADLSLARMIQRAAGSLPADLSLARMIQVADESGRFAPSGLVAGADDSESDPAAGSDKAADESDKAADESDKAASYIFHFSFLTMEEYFSDSMDMILPSLAPNASAS